MYNVTAISILYINSTNKSYVEKVKCFISVGLVTLKFFGDINFRS